MNRFSNFLPAQLAREKAKLPLFDMENCITAGEYLNLEPIKRCLVIKNKALCKGAMNKMNKVEIDSLENDPTDC